MEWQSTTTATPKRAQRFLDQLRQRCVIGPVEPRQPHLGFVAAPACRDRSPRRRARCAGMTPRPAATRGARRIDRHRPGRRRTCRHPVRRAPRLTSQKGAGKSGRDQRRAQSDDAGEQLVHKGVFRAAQGQWRPAGCAPRSWRDRAGPNGARRKRRARSGAPGAAAGTARHKAAARAASASASAAIAGHADGSCAGVDHWPAKRSSRAAAAAGGKLRAVNRSLRFARYRLYSRARGGPHGAYPSGGRR